MFMHEKYTNSLLLQATNQLSFAKRKEREATVNLALSNGKVRPAAPLKLSN